jgi:hypothetical protein
MTSKPVAIAERSKGMASPLRTDVTRHHRVKQPIGAIQITRRSGRCMEELVMPNKYRGEIAAELGGHGRTLVLTLGALAELESAFGTDDLGALAERFGSGRLSARDLVRIIAAGLRGAGENVSDDEVAAMTVDGGASGYVRIAAELIAATFEDTSTPAAP